MMPSPTPFTVRPAAPPDAVALAALRGALFRELRHAVPPGEPGAFEHDAALAFAEGLAKGDCLAWLAEAGDDGQPVGAVALLILPRLPTPEAPARREGYLLNVYTEPSWRGRGVATALVAAAVTKARDLGLARIRLHATADGAPVYAAAGFAPRLNEMELRL